MDVKLITAITDIDSKQWNSLVGKSYPFLLHEFLSALEQSGSVRANTGWQPQHLLIYDNGELIALMPLYLKTHSRGEYVFDLQWAHSYARHGLDYYPKWVTAIPFTPCQGQRIICQDMADPIAIYQTIITFLKDSSALYGTSSWHCLFPTTVQTEIFQDLGLAIREGIQYQWFNRDYRDFADYLDSFTSAKRKQIKRERRRVAEQDIVLKQISGADIGSHHWQVFFQFYSMTYLKYGMPAYLNLDCFKRLAETMTDSLFLVIAEKDHTPVGAALSFVDNDTLYGRYWGCFEEYKNLHFETCYYQGIDYCINHGLKRFDSGAQGEHKIARGFEPVSTWSAHWIKNPDFAVAITKFLDQERVSIQLYKKYAQSLLPFKASQ